MIAISPNGENGHVDGYLPTTSPPRQMVHKLSVYIFTRKAWGELPVVHLESEAFTMPISLDEQRRAHAL